MNQQIEPTYLRYIYDGLAKGIIHPDNASALPEGLIGLYEEAFNENIPVAERQKLLQRFAIWALLKKEVSANFVAEVIEESEEDIQNFIATYSKWFNSPESGKYTLYHERLRVFILQKFSELSIIDLNNRLIFVLEKSLQSDFELFIYKLQYLISHITFGSFFSNNRLKLIENLNNSDFRQNQVDFRISRDLIFEERKIAITLVMQQNDWDLLESITSSALEYHKMIRYQIETDFKSSFSEFKNLYDHFYSAPDTEEKIRMFFLMFLEDRNLKDELLINITYQIKQFAEQEYIGLSEIAPIWLINKVKKLFINDNNIRLFFDDADHNELVEYVDIEPNFIYLTENYKDYPQVYKNDYDRVLQILNSSEDLDDMFFLDIYESICPSNLISRDEILCRVTIDLITNRLKSNNCINWFVWLVAKSKFELGEHSGERTNTYELCILFLKKGNLNQVKLLIKNLNEIEMDYHTKIKLRNIISERLFIAGHKQDAKNVLISFDNRKGEHFKINSWVKSWVFLDLENRKKAKELINNLDQLEVCFEEYRLEKKINLLSFKNSELFFRLNKLDKVSKAEYYADFATRTANKDLKQFMIKTAYDLVNGAKDWAELFAKMSILTAALEIMPEKWNKQVFKGLKSNFSLFELEEYGYQLAETLFKTEKFRFANIPPYQNLKVNYPKEFKYLSKNFRGLISKSEDEINFKYFLINDLNKYCSIKEMWKAKKIFFRTYKTRESFSFCWEYNKNDTFFWDYIIDDTKLFEKFTAEDVRIINIISRMVKLRFPYERFIDKHPKVLFYSERYVIPDAYNLGVKEGCISMARFNQKLDWDNEFRIVFSAALKGPSNRYVNIDWTNESIHPLAFAIRKILPFADDVYKVNSLLNVRKMLKSYL